MSEKKKVYVETTVVSDMTARPSLNVKNLARQIVTRDWWEFVSGKCLFVASQLVDVEAARGDEDAAKRRLELLKDIPHLEYGAEALNLAKKFLEAVAIPANSFDDATHVAIAAINKAEFIATWNCTHINNPQTLPAVMRVCEENGYKCPIIGTPEQLKEVSYE